MLYLTLDIMQVDPSPFMKIPFSSTCYVLHVHVSYLPYSGHCGGSCEVNKDEYDLIPAFREFITQRGKMPQFGGR